jgi:glutaconate CoA-transferase subunit A
MQWDKISETPEAVKQYLDEWVYGVTDRQQYWEKLGQAAHKRLSVEERLSVAVNYGQY